MDNKDNIIETVQRHGLKIQELEDEIDFKKWKIDSLIEKIDNLTTVVQQIQINQLKDENNLITRVKAIETELALQKTTNIENHNRISQLLTIIGVGLTIITIMINVYFQMI